jgi:hypothetical protein
MNPDPTVEQFRLVWINVLLQLRNQLLQTVDPS